MLYDVRSSDAQAYLAWGLQIVISETLIPLAITKAESLNSLTHSTEVVAKEW
jgi:hypothetical protein